MEVFQPHQGQLEVIQNNSRFRLLNCGRRWGKTTLLINEMLAYASLRPKSLVVYYSPSFTQSRDIAWRMLRNTAPSYGEIKNINETRLEIKINQSEIWLRGVENFESARGLGIHFLVIDELAMMRNWYNIWEEVLRSTLADTSGIGLFASTPKGYNHWHSLWEKGQRKEDGYESWTFESDTNPYLKKEEIEAAKKELRQEAFEQEWQAKFRTTVGLAHPQFDRNIHLIPSFDIPSDWQRGRGFDFGSAHPTASVRIAIDNDDNWFVDAYYKQSGKTIQDHANTIKSQDYGKGFIPIWGDPSGGQWFTEFQQHDLNIQPAIKEMKTSSRNWVEYCVESVNQKLKPVQGHIVMLPDGRKIENAPKLFFLDNIGYEKMIYELENLKWKDTKEGGLTPTLDENLDTEGHFDLLAALRYFSVSYQNSQTDDIPIEVEEMWKSEQERINRI